MLAFTLIDFDHEHERTCEVRVALDLLGAELRWELSVDEDYLPEEQSGPATYAFTESIWFDEVGEMESFVRNALKDLRANCYRLYGAKGKELRDLPEELLDLTSAAKRQGTALSLPGNSERHKVPLERIEQAYGRTLPPPLRAFLATSWRTIDRKKVLDLPGERIDGHYLGLTAPVIIDVLGENLIENAHLYVRPELCAWAKFVGQGLGLRYFGVLQSDRAGRIYVTTSDERFLIAGGIDDLVPLLLNPSKVPRKPEDAPKT